MLLLWPDMRFLLGVSVTTLFAASSMAMGPGPFSNGSPLPSGNDGTYQASARGTNLAGVIRFAVQSGSQLFGSELLTPSSTQQGLNSWAIFFEGKLYTGLTDAVISGSNITGVLSAPTSILRAITNLQSDGGIVITDPATGLFPADALIRGQNLSGFFEASLDQKSPMGSFSGNGEVAVTIPPIYTVNLQPPGAPVNSSITQVPDPAAGYGGLTPIPPNPPATFRIRGTRTSISVPVSTAAGGLQ